MLSIKGGDPSALLSAGETMLRELSSLLPGLTGDSCSEPHVFFGRASPRQPAPSPCYCSGLPCRRCRTSFSTSQAFCYQGVLLQPVWVEKVSRPSSLVCVSPGKPISRNDHEWHQNSQASEEQRGKADLMGVLFSILHTGSC